MSTLINKDIEEFYPVQPGFKINTQYYLEKKVLINNKNLLFYQFKTDKIPDKFIQVLPDGCFDIIFSCNPGVYGANIYGQLLQSKMINFGICQEYFGIRMLPQYRIKSLNISMKEIIENKIPLNKDFIMEPNWIEKIVKKESFEDRIDYFTKIVNNSPIEVEDGPKLIINCIKKIYSTNGKISITDLSKKIGYSEQYIRIKFQEFIGTSPKKFSSIVRFQKALEMLINQRDNNYSEIMYQNGYYDQAHLIKEFKNFGILSPNKYLKSLRNS
ncbi:helix-turn-helix domain-containing protein [Clostridium grantii]|uniref:AraC-type DNA-binding protein n=1 Tax=Clostridium grantii DSM 8605 TaxID=1121316 RepID=A0A1M5VBL5_9CLOT|nr:AraC family transcriptional regulator [Clostridium grantii]SHH72672.1 AraC-type DNA-binding protein [Clostridium grantii DSM 8605]